MSQQEVSPSWIGAEPKFGVDWVHPCALHLGELEIDPISPDGENYPSCPECGCLFETSDCSWCGAEWITFGDNAIDDTIRSAAINSSGDLMCARCLGWEDEETGEEYSEDWQDDYP